MLTVGSKIKSQKVILQDDSTVSFPEKGKAYILFFYPEDNSPGCTNEVCSFRDAYSELRKMGYEIYGVSPDKAASHQKFIDKHQLPFPLIADTERKLIDYFGVWGQKKFMGREYVGLLRTTFVIDKNSTISHIVEKVQTKKAAEQVLLLLKNN